MRTSFASARRWSPSNSASPATASPIRAAAATSATPGWADIEVVVREEAGRGTRELLVVPIGFVCDHVEVLYDLDIEARQIAEEVGIGFTRAETVNDHPSFIRMLAAVVAAQAAA
ncbi:MAG: ferrochelatase [Candidatus Binatia bacterium]